MKRISVTFDSQLYSAIERAAAEAGVSKSELVRRIIREGVNADRARGAARP